jgi:hypothetical protein
MGDYREFLIAVIIIAVAVLGSPVMLKMFPFTRELSPVFRSLLCVLLSGAMFIAVVFGWHLLMRLRDAFGKDGEK